jgi:outer membrane receptor protein involved in Fe transport
MGKHMNKLQLSLLFLIAFTFAPFNVIADEPVDGEAEVASTETESDDSDEDVTDVGRVTVTGSRIKRIDIEGATPVTVITRTDIDQAGYGTVFDAVSNLTQNIGTTAGENFQAGFTPANQVIDLRDFGPGRTLVLVNGKRMADYPFPYNGNSASFNWASIPLAAVERIEVLTAGASSVYGSDAVAGVINVVLVEGVEKSTLRVTAGEYLQSRDGFGKEYAVEFTTGGVADKFSWTVAAEFRHLDPLTTKDRDDYDDYDDGKYPTGDVPWYASRMYGADPLQGGYQFWGPSDMLGPDGQSMGWTCAGSTNIDGVIETTYDQYYETTRVGNACIREENPPQTIWNERDNASVFFAGSYTISENAEVYAKAMQFNTETTGVYFNSFYYPYPNTPWSVGYSNYGPAKAARPNPVTGGQMYLMDWYGVKMFNPPTWDNSFEETSTTFDLGVRGVLSNGWEYDVSATINDYESDSVGMLWLVQEMEELYFNIGQNDALGNPCVMDAYDLYADGYWAGPGDIPTDPYYMYYRSYLWGQPTCLNAEWFYNGADFDYQNYMAENDEHAESYSDFYTASLVGEFGMLAGGPIGFAAVVEYQDHGYTVIPSAANVAGLLWGSGYTDGGGSRDRYAIGGELRFPLTTEFAVMLSARNDKYDDKAAKVDRTTIGGNFEWRPSEDFMLRGSWSESFRAPDMQRAFLEQVEGFTSGIDYYQCWLVTGAIDDCGDYSKINIKSITTGNKSLKDEAGDSYSLGFVWQPAERLSVTVDAYKVILQDIVSNSSLGQIRIDEAYCRAQEAGTPIANAPDYSASYCQQVYDSITRDGKPTGVEPGDPNAIPGMTELYNQPLNIASQEYQGLDWSLRYTLITDTRGDFGFSVRGSNQLNLKQATLPGEPRNSYMDSSYVVRSRQVATTSWNLNDWSASISVSRIGHVNYVEDTKGSPYMETNLTVGYDVTDDIYVAVVGNNIFDQFPDRDAAYGGSSYYPFHVNANLYPITGPSVNLLFNMNF